MMVYDSEDLLDSIYNIMTSGDALNNKILEIEAEKTSKGKGLSPTLSIIDSDSYFVQTWDDNILNKPLSIFYGIEDVQSNDGGGVVSSKYKVFVEVVMVDNNLYNDSYKRIARYSRALKELFQKAIANEIPISRVSIDTVRPIAFKLELDTSDEIKIGGVSLLIDLVN